MGWGLLICLANRPSSRAACDKWGVAVPGLDLFSEVDASLRGPRIAELFDYSPTNCADQQDDTDQVRLASESTQAVTSPFLAHAEEDGWESGEVGLKDMHDRSGICWTCCHNLPAIFHGFLSMFGSFPNHPTLWQCLTPQNACDYQRLGAVVTLSHEDMLHAALSLLSD